MTTNTSLMAHIACPITMEPMQNPYLTLPCGHSFERDAIAAWQAQNGSCPLDRTTIQEIRPNTPLKELIEQVQSLSSKLTNWEDEVKRLKGELIEIKRTDTEILKQIDNKRKEELELTLATEKEEGFFFLSCCAQESCSLKGQNVWVNKGMDKLNFNRLCYTLRCPNCNSKVEESHSAALRGSYYHYEGQKKTGELIWEKVERGEEVAIRLFVYTSEWKYIEATFINRGETQQNPKL